jgi:AcrR family transcriptional regulator
MEWYSINMDHDVKGSPGRRERKAQQTRRRVLAAAEALFVGDGYGATTIIAIAEAADVAVQTVYAVFGSKRAILAELVEARIAGDGQPRRLRDRQDWQAMEREPDPRRQIERLAAIATRIGEQVAALSEVVAAAAATDPEIADLHASQQRARYEDQRRLARSLARKGALRPGLPEDRAADVIWALVNARTYRSLVGDRRWTADEYERWLGSLLACALLGQ